MTLRAGVFLYDIGVGYEAGVAAHLARDTLVELEGFRATAAFPRQTADGAALLLQQFFGDKVYLKVGPRVRRFSARSDYGDTDLEKHLDQVDIGGDFGFGMRKQTDGFVYGFDFIGVYVPAAKFSAREKIVDPKNGEVLDETPKDFSLRVDVRLPGFYIGGCF